MANIIINVDTEKDTIKVSIDGKNISDVQEVRSYLSVPWDGPVDADPEVRVEIISGTKDEESGINRTLITTCSKELIEEKDALTESLIAALKL